MIDDVQQFMDRESGEQSWLDRVNVSNAMAAQLPEGFADDEVSRALRERDIYSMTIDELKREEQAVNNQRREIRRLIRKRNKQ